MTLLFDEFQESEHPRGKPGNRGQFASAAGGGNTKGEGKGEHEGKAQPDFRDSLAHESTESSKQPVKSLEELYERAKAEEPAFKDIVSAIAKEYGAEVLYTPEKYAEPGTILKSKSSAVRKLQSELGGDPTLLRDVLRATVVSDTVESTRKVAAKFIGLHGSRILRVKDRYADPLRGGYRDILINYRTPDGLVSEIQFNSKNMTRTKNEKAHKLYETVRELPPGAGTAATVEKLEQQMAAMYERAYQDDGDGNGWKKQVHDSAGKFARYYKLSQTDGPSFQAAIVEQQGGKVEVISNRNGNWGPDAALHYVDLIMPEQELSDWDVSRIELDQVEKDKKPLAFDVEREEREKVLAKDQHTRALDRTFDIEYVVVNGYLVRKR